MNDSYYLVVFALAAVFAGAGAIKGAIAWRAGQSYRFSWWEGALFRGKMLTRTGTQVKTVLSVVVVFGCVLYLADVPEVGVGLATTALGIMIIGDIAGRRDAT